MDGSAHMVQIRVKGTPALNPIQQGGGDAIVHIIGLIVHKLT